MRAQSFNGPARPRLKTGRRGFAFDLVDERPYTRRDGAVTTVKVWEALCINCRQPFQIVTPAAVVKPKQSHAFNLRRCPACRGKISA